jgi:hypothetical protein
LDATDSFAAAARAWGCPAEIVDVILAQIKSITKLQIHTMDQMMDAPRAMTSFPSVMLSKLKSLPDGELAKRRPLSKWRR